MLEKEISIMNVSFKSAASGGNLNVKSGNTVKTVGKVLVGSALIAGGLAVAAKTGKLDYSGHNKFASAVLKTAKTVGTKIADAAIAVKNKVLTKSKNTFVDAPVVGTDRSSEAVKLYEKAVLQDKLEKAEKAFEKATDWDVKCKINSQIMKLASMVYGK